jgi:DNA-binding transcriptional regulator LsrR (DeoR family)
MLMLLKAGTTQGEIAAALGVDQSVISRMLPARKIRKTNG